MENIKNELAEILEVDSVETQDQLSGFECWDSLTILSIIALASESYDVTLSAKDVNDADTVGGLIALIESKK